MLHLRRQRPDEGPALTELCLRSKAAHGYDEAFMEACRRELTVDSEMECVTVADDGGACLVLRKFRLPAKQRDWKNCLSSQIFTDRGSGALLDWAVSEAQRRGARCLMVDSDPSAAAIYERMGAELEGKSPSGSIPGRFLPRLRLALDGAGHA